MGFEIFAATKLNIRFSRMWRCVSAYRIPKFRSKLVSSILEVIISEVFLDISTF